MLEYKNEITLTNESLTERTRNRTHKQEQTHNQTPHTLRRLRKRILQPRNTRKYLRQRNQHVRACLYPHIQGARDTVTIGVFTRACAISAWVGFVEVVLEDGCPDHGCCAGEEARCDLFDGCEADTVTLEEWVDELVADGDEDDECEGVEVP